MWADDSPVQNAGLGNLYDCPFFMAAPAAPIAVAPKPRTIIYIDGFNLYYGAVRGTPALKWLNLSNTAGSCVPTMT